MSGQQRKTVLFQEVRQAHKDNTEAVRKFLELDLTPGELVNTIRYAPLSLHKQIMDRVWSEAEKPRGGKNKKYIFTRDDIFLLGKEGRDHADAAVRHNQAVKGLRTPDSNEIAA